MDIHIIAVLARSSTTTLSEAETLIENYASVIAGQAVMKALEEAHLRTMRILEAPLTRTRADA